MPINKLELEAINLVLLNMKASDFMSSTRKPIIKTLEGLLERNKVLTPKQLRRRYIQIGIKIARKKKL